MEGLAIGTDDYMVKPFSLQALRARVGALMRRADGGGNAATPCTMP